MKESKNRKEDRRKGATLLDIALNKETLKHPFGKLQQVLLNVVASTNRGNFGHLYKGTVGTIMSGLLGPIHELFFWQLSKTFVGESLCLNIDG